MKENVVVMPLIHADEFAEASKLKSLRMALLSPAIMKILKIDDLNKIYEKFEAHEGLAFIEAVLEELSISYEVNENSIPAEGPFLAIANHPYGALDGLILLHIFGQKRPDFKVMANFLLQRILTLQSFFIPVNPFDEGLVKGGSFGGLRACLQHLQAGHPIGIFPAGAVSAFESKSKKIVDKQWSHTVAKIIMKTKVPVVPVHFKGTNSRLFHLLGRIHANLGTVRLPSELLNKKGKKIQVRVGKTIPYKNLADLQDAEELTLYLRARTYAIGSSLEVKKYFSPPFLVRKKPKDLIPATPQALLEKELQQITAKRLLTQAPFEVYLADSREIPFILNEIGRLRELTFRTVGEGTNKSFDRDRFDLDYGHLFVWDTLEKCIVGAYRIGKGDELFDKYGPKGFYLNTLFKFDENFYPILQSAVELGRSFIRKEYQQKYLPLFLLWRGILAFINQNSSYKFVIGPVSISSYFSPISKALITAYIRKHYFEPELSKWVTARKEFAATAEDTDTQILLKTHEGDLKKIDRLIAEIEPYGLSMPVLLKKYIKQNAKIIGFNIDPKFNNALDGLMVMNVEDIPQETVALLKSKTKI